MISTILSRNVLKLRKNNVFIRIGSSKNFSSDNNESSSNDPPNNGKKNIQKSNVNSLNANKPPNVPQKKRYMARELDDLMKLANKIRSIPRDDPNSISNILSKPKTFIRESARPESDKKDPNELYESSEYPGATVMEQKLAQAAKRIIKKMPKHLRNKMEDDFLKTQDNVLIGSTETNLNKKQLKKKDISKGKPYRRIISENDSDEPIIGEDIIPTKSISEILSKKLNENSFIKNEFKQRPRKFNEKDHNQDSSMRSSGTRKSNTFTDSDYNEYYRKMFKGAGLNIFNEKSNFLTDNSDTYWNKLDEMERMSKKNPSNFFEEMIKWTEEGKLWKYPIDNEQGLDDEAEVPFYEHVLLDDLLVDFPKTGPVRHFMELIIMGLSHNPHITVERKHQTIEYYKEFFDKNGLLNPGIIENSDQTVASAV